jgi:hypothetical protein
MKYFWLYCTPGNVLIKICPSPFTVTCYRLPCPRIPREHCFSAPFVSIVAPWGEVTDNMSLCVDFSISPFPFWQSLGSRPFLSVVGLFSHIEVLPSVMRCQLSLLHSDSMPCKMALTVSQQETPAVENLGPAEARAFQYGGMPMAREGLFSNLARKPF